MSDTEFTIIAIAFSAYGYLAARVLDYCRDLRERQRRDEARKASYMAARRVTLHPAHLARIQDLAELDDLRDYIRRGDA